MKTIKFRAWDKRFKKMDFGGGALLLRINSTDFSEPMQFTGLHDKNGKEIFEGDVVNVFSTEEYSHDPDGTECEEECQPKCLYPEEGEKVVVKWNDNFGGFTWDESEVFDGEYTMGFSDDAGNYTFEIIGNIYENPELINS